MLIKTPVKKGDTISMKLSSGEEIIASYTDESDTTLTVSKVRLLAAGPKASV